MASRRTRIKGIANIPQRKRTNQENNESAVDISNIGNTLEDNNESNSKSLSSTLLASKPQDDTENITDNLDSKNTILGNSVGENKTDVLETKKLENKHDCPKIEITNEIKQNQNTEINDSQKSKSYMGRRKFLKPGINLNAVKKRENSNELLPAVQNTASEQNTSDQEVLDKNTTPENTSIIKHEVANKEVTYPMKPTDKVVVLSEIRIPKQETKSMPVSRDLTNNISNESYYGCDDQKSELTLNETYLGINEIPIVRSSVVTFAPNIKRIMPETHISDNEYPAPPPSPSKINRSRIKAIPRFHQRKTSCSASESEDETRKYGRIRNNSVCSVVSTTCLEPPTPTSETQPTKEFVPVLQKKINRSEQSRKLAEARREFHKRFGLSNPDKQRLKMIDLIFYNPTSNPMSQKSNKPQIEDKYNKAKEEVVDTPLNVDEVEDKTDVRVNNADSSMPVPQIKIGPSGEIILDEQSLIVENAEIAKQKEQILNSKLVDGDFDIGYGVYKKLPRASAWTQKETLRFYKALNLIGTDFTVMTQLFPKRNRRELKIKFKKEEKVNRHLIDKAIMQPCSYNFTDLKREIQIEEEEEAALEKLRQEEIKRAFQEKLEKKRKAKEAKTAKSSLGIISNEEAKDKEDSLVLPPKKRIKSLEKPFKIKLKPRKIKAKPLNINAVLDDSDADISDMETQSESEEEEIIPFLKPTRSGRMPKSTMKFTTITEEPIPRRLLTNRENYPIAEDPLKQPSNMTKLFTTADDATRSSNAALRQRRSSSLSSIESNSEKLVPGSVVIMTEEDANNQLQYKVFMVTPERKMTPLELDSETIAKLIKEKQNEKDFDFVEPPIPEKNITIAATGENEEPESGYQKSSE